MSTKFTRASKENVIEGSVNGAFMVNEKNLVFTEFTRSPREFAEFTVVTELHLVNKGNLFRSVSTKQGQPMKDFVNLRNKV